MTSEQRKTRWLRAGVGLFWVLGISLILWFGWRFRNDLVPFLAGVNPWGLGKAFSWFLLSLVAIVAGWVALMRHFSPGLHWWTHVRIYCVTLATRRLPGTLWYVGGRLVLYRREGISRALVSIASSVEYAVIIVSGGLVGLVLLPAAVEIPGAAAGALALAALLVLLSPRLVAWLARRIGRPLPVAIGFLDVLGWLAALGVMWLCGGMMLVEIIRSFSPLPNDQAIFVLGAWAITGTLGALTFALPSSFGVGDISLALLLAQIMPLMEAGTIAVMARFIGLLFEILTAAVFLPWIRKAAPEP
jgi:hypothetical protein